MLVDAHGLASSQHGTAVGAIKATCVVRPSPHSFVSSDLDTLRNYDPFGDGDDGEWAKLLRPHIEMDFTPPLHPHPLKLLG